MPANAAEVAGDFAKVGGRIAVEHGAGKGAEQEAQNPANDDGVADGDAGGADERQEPEDSPDFTAAAFGGFTKGADRTGAHGTAEGHFAHDAAETQSNDKNQKRYKKGEAAVLTNAIRKQPDTAHANSRTDAGHDETETAAKGITRMRIFCQDESPLYIFSQQRASADAAEDNTKNENDKGDAAVNVLADAFNEIAPLMGTASVDFLGCETFAADPEEHDRCQKRCKRRDVDGEQVHPVADNVGIFEEDPNKEAERQHERTGFAALHAKVLLQGLDGAFVEIDQ